MSDGDGEGGPATIAGLSTAEAAETVIDADDSLDQATVRDALGRVSTDGVVSRDAADEAIAEAAKVVSTPETRAELAAIALEKAREGAEGVDDLDAVSARLAGFESRLSAIDARIETLGADLRGLVDGDAESTSLFEIGREIGRIRTEANELQHAADELQVDLEAFQTWLDDPAVRAEELDADVDALAASLSGLEETLDAVESVVAGNEEVVEEDADGGTATDGETSTDVETDDPGEAWAEAAIGHRVTGLLLADLRVELADLRTMADRADGADDAGLDVVESQMGDLTERRDAIGERVDALGRPAWRERFVDRLAAVDDVLASFEPPVAWGEVQNALDRAQA